jgi:hypothetical protein
VVAEVRGGAVRVLFCVLRYVGLQCAWCSVC